MNLLKLTHWRPFQGDTPPTLNCVSRGEWMYGIIDGNGEQQFKFEIFHIQNLDYNAHGDKCVYFQLSSVFKI